MDEKYVCCICGKECTGYGNNPEPIVPYASGQRCCDQCNAEKVIPKRLELLWNK